MVNWAIKYTGKDLKNNTDVPRVALCAYSNHKVKHHVYMQLSYQGRFLWSTMVGIHHLRFMQADFF